MYYYGQKRLVPLTQTNIPKMNIFKQNSTGDWSAEMNKGPSKLIFIQTSNMCPFFYSDELWAKVISVPTAWLSNWDEQLCLCTCCIPIDMNRLPAHSIFWFQLLKDSMYSQTMAVSACVNEALYLPAPSFVPWIFALLMRATCGMCGPPWHAGWC